MAESCFGPQGDYALQDERKLPVVVDYPERDTAQEWERVVHHPYTGHEVGADVKLLTEAGDGDAEDEDYKVHNLDTPFRSWSGPVVDTLKMVGMPDIDEVPRAPVPFHRYPLSHSNPVPLRFTFSLYQSLGKLAQLENDALTMRIAPEALAHHMRPHGVHPKTNRFHFVPHAIGIDEYWTKGCPIPLDVQLLTGRPTSSDRRSWFPASGSASGTRQRPVHMVLRPNAHSETLRTLYVAQRRIIHNPAFRTWCTFDPIQDILAPLKAQSQAHHRHYTVDAPQGDLHFPSSLLQWFGMSYTGTLLHKAEEDVGDVVENVMGKTPIVRRFRLPSKMTMEFLEHAHANTGVSEAAMSLKDGVVLSVTPATAASWHEALAPAIKAGAENTMCSLGISVVITGVPAVSKARHKADLY